MKIDRLFEIVIYLLNHEKASANQLANLLEVSVRTIQRDMVSLSAAGIPIVADTGVQGGYSILQAYKVKNQFLRQDEMQYILMALKSLGTGYENEKINQILEKYLSVIEEEEAVVYIDNSTAKEDSSVQKKLYDLERAVYSRKQIQFIYVDAVGRRTEREVQPFTLKYKWQAWYLYAFDVGKQAYRCFKVARIKEVQVTDAVFKKFDNGAGIVARMEREYLDTCVRVKIWCHASAVDEIEETFIDMDMVKQNDGSYVIELLIPPNEKLWSALLISFGEKVKVLSPDSYRDEVRRNCQSFLKNYDT